ncbi:MAG: amino acid adenylation domain-containing protein [Flammeovirgaceae bacterium]
MELKSITDLIVEAKEKGITLFLEKNKLQFSVAKGVKPEPSFVALLKENKEGIIEVLNEANQQRAENSMTSLVIEKRPQKLPLSFAQKRIWFIDKLQGSVNYNLPSIWELRGDLDVESLAYAFKELINRHEIIRTVYQEEDGFAYQEILPTNTFELSLQEVPESELATAIDAYIHHPFDLSSDLMLRARVFPLSAGHYRLVIVVHHIATDGWSMGLLKQELAAVYNAKKAQRVPQLPALPIQYADFALWQSKQLESEKIEQQLNYWEQKLEDVATLDMPTDFKRPAKQSQKGAVMHFLIEKELSEKTTRLAQQEGVTLFTFLLASLNILLYRYSGQKDICLGSPMIDRAHPDLEPLMGLFLNNLVLRNDLSNNPTFLEFLAQVKQTTLEAYQHQDVPFEKIVDRLTDGRDLSRSPLFQATFTYHSHLEESNEELSLTDLAFEEINHETTTSLFDLSFHMVSTPAGITLAIHYCNELFSSDTIQQLAQHYEQLLGTIVSNPHERIAQLEMLSSAEKTALLDLTATETSYPQEHSVAELFNAQVANSPQAKAVMQSGESLSYEELNSKANKLANYLQAQGIQQHDRVGIYLERSFDLLVSMLAILKIGASYVPLDAQQPANRTDFILEDAEIKWVISSMGFDTQTMFYEPLFAPREGIESLILDELEWETLPQTTSVVSGLAQTAACIMYTSGSTGKPKGVVVPHQAIVRLVFNKSFSFLGADTVFFQYAPIAFDASTIEIWGALLKGGCVALSSSEQKSLESIASELKEMEVNTLWLTAGLFHSAIEDCIELFEGIAYMIAGGDSISTESVRTLLQQYPEMTFINGYGPTESTTFAIVHPVHSPEELTEKNVIGRPIDNTRVYFLNEANQLVPRGAIGELCIGGDGLALGYLNLKELTEEKFQADPFHPVAGKRLYHTGDLGRWLPDGTIEFLGRKDNQVKIRGFRIELDEIEAVLQKAPTVIQSVVLVHQEQQVKRLVAYVRTDEAFDQGTIQSYLKKELPEYMVPHHYVEIAEFPLTLNGKINKKKLPVPGATLLSQQEAVAPTTPTEKLLATIWEEVLGIAQLGIHDNFFSAGGDSIIAIRVISRIKKKFEKDVSVADFFQAPTIAELATFIDLHAASSQKNQALRDNILTQLTQVKKDVLERVENADELADIFPMSDIQKGMVFSSLINPGKGVYHDQMLFPFPSLERPVFEKALTLLVQKHAILRTSFHLNQYQEPLQFVHKHVPITIDFHDLTQEKDNSYVKQYMLDALEHPFQVHEAPLWRASLFQVSRNTVLLLFQFHHSMLDGWSFASLTTELYNIYQELLKDTDYTPVPLKASYKDGIIENLIEKSNQETISFWQQELAAYKRLSVFSQEQISGQYTVNYDADYLKKVTQAASELGVSVRSLFFSAYLFTMNMLSFENDLTVGMVTNIRPTTEDGDKVLGCFLNTIPFRYQVPTNQKTWKEFLLGVDKKVRSLKGKDRLTLIEITKLLNEQSEAGNPFFDVLFNFVDFHVYDEMQVESELIETQELLELQSHEATNTYFDISVSATGGELNILYVLRRALKLSYGLEEIAHFFKATLDHLVDHAHQKIDQAAILPDDMSADLFTNFIAEEQAYPQDQTLLDVIDEQVKKHPNQLAIVGEKEQLSYQELDEQSNQLAHYLIRKGVKNEGIVGLVLDREPSTIIAILAVLKAGAAYLPIDTTYPKNRVKYMMEESKAHHLISQSSYTALWDELEEVTIVCLDTEATIQLEAKERPKVKIDPKNLAYVIYTSGSTGKPKGVLVEHGGIMNMALDQIAKFGIAHTDAVLQFASLSFDVSVLEIFSTLLAGGRLVIGRKQLMDSSEAFVAYLKAQEVSVLIITAAHLSALDINQLQFLRAIITGGEAPDVATAVKCTEFADYYNSYGPTETTVCVTTYQVSKQDEGKTTIPLGKPNANLKVYILDEDASVLPTSSVGELCIAGPSVARGYLNRPELTTEKFIKNPFGAGKMYRTGDLARWLPNGHLEFVGRKDSQVKIRGHRVELGEIDDALTSLAEVKQAATITQKDRRGIQQLIAFIVCAQPCESRLLQSKLQKELPEYMVPQQMQFLDQFPLTANGKVDKKALANMSSQIQTAYKAPRNEAEEWLAQLWGELLDVEQVGVHDNFFELGGHSLLATKVVSAIRNKYALDIGVKRLFELKTLEAIAEQIQVVHGNTLDANQQYTEIEL